MPTPTTLAWLGILWRDGLIGCVDGSFVALRSEQKSPFWCRKSYFALNFMFTCVADMRILTVDPLRPRSDDDSHICVGPQI
ncbi:hypothetical protein MRX96_032416 [Rhipicephalus microplus]